MPDQPTGAAADTMSYAASGDLRTVRAFVAARAATLGLAPERVESLTLAVSELTTNTLQHTGGGGRVRLWVDDGHLVCDVVDSGPARTFGRVMPSAEALRGRGLAIVERVCDEVAVSTVADGTMVRVRLAL